MATTATTLANAMTALSQSITLAGGRLHADDLVAIDAEYVRVLRALSDTHGLVQRGQNGSVAAAHAASAVATIGLPQDFLTGPQLLPPFGIEDDVYTGNGPTAASSFQAGGGGAGSPSAPDLSIQFNDDGAFGGVSGLILNPATSTVTSTVTSFHNNFVLNNTDYDGGSSPVNIVFDDSGVFAIGTFNGASLTLWDTGDAQINIGGAGELRLVGGQWTISSDGALTALGGNLTVDTSGNVVTIGSISGALIPPTSDPHIAGALWNNAGTLTISAG